MTKMKKMAVLTAAALCAFGIASSAMAASLAEIKQKGELTLLTATGFPPFEYLGDGGKPAGIDIDLGALIAKELGVKLNVLDMSFNLLIESLKGNKGDLVAAGMTVTDERKTQVDFTICYIKNGLTLLTPKGSSIKGAEDLKSKTVAVQESTTAHIYAQEKLGLQPMAFLNVIECANALKAGKADAAILDFIPALSLAMINPELEALKEPIVEEDLGMAVAKGNTELLEAVNAVLEKAMKDGTVDAILDKHLKLSAQN